MSPRDDTPQLVLGTQPTQWIIAAGDGHDAYTPDGIVCHYDETPLEVPEWLVSARKQVEADAQSRQRQKDEGQAVHLITNESRYTFEAYQARSVGSRPKLDLHFRACDYFTFLASQRSLEAAVVPAESGERISPRQYLDRFGWRQPVPALSHSFGVALAVVTADGFVIVGRRGTQVQIRPGYLIASVSEGLSMADSPGLGQAPNIYSCAARGIHEELGICVGRHEVRLLSLGVDTETNQWGMLGLARVDLAARDLECRHAHASDASEQSIEFVRFAPEQLVGYLHANGPWAPEGLACIYHAAVHEYGRDTMEREFAR